MSGNQSASRDINVWLSARKAGGFPLPAALRQKMEWAFQSDFSEVRIHLGQEPLYFNTIAFASGPHIFMLPEVYAPRCGRCLEIIAHELAHVLQQRNGIIISDAEKGGFVNKEILEQEAVAAGRSVAMGRQVAIKLSLKASFQMPTVQTYTVVDSANFATNNPQITVNNPRSHLVVQGPAAVDYSHDSFIVQAKVVKSFLGIGNNINYRSFAHNSAALSLRVSQNGKMAIQDCILEERQPKVFYATDDIIAECNARLTLIGSHIRLVILDNQRTLTVDNHTLRRVMPYKIQNRTSGLNMGSGDCASVIGEVTGGGSSFLVPRDVAYIGNLGLLWEFDLATGLNILFNAAHGTTLDYTTPVTMATTARAIATRYATNIRANPNHANLANNKLNQYVAPEVGDGFLTSSLRVIPVDGTGAPVGGFGTGITNYTIEDHINNGAGGALLQTLDQRLTWGNHWGGVVAKDGDDVITLENYARNVEDALSTDERYYFQMYNTNGGAARNQTWHGQWVDMAMAPFGNGLNGFPTPPVANWGGYPAPTHKPVSPGARSFTNPISCGVTIPNTQYDTIAQNLYNVIGVDAIKDDHDQIATSTTADVEIRNILKGLFLANDRIASNTSETTARINAWVNALTAAYLAARFRQNLIAIDYTISRLNLVTT